MQDFLLAFGVSFAVIFVAELGDKSQLMALTFATRYRTLPVLIGITLATSIVHLVSVAVGYGLGAALPTGWISLAAALAFFGFGAWTLRGDALTEEEREKANRNARSAVLAVGGAFFLAELGDKTMLATITLATQHGWFGVWLGSTIGMVAADALAIVVGRLLGRNLPERAIRYAAAAGFVLFGIVLLAESVGELTGRPAGELLASAADHHLVGWTVTGLGLVAMIVLLATRHWARADSRRQPTPGGTRSAALWSQVLLGVATVLGLTASVLVGADIIQPFALFSAPSVVVVGAALFLLGFALLLASLAHIGTVRRRSGEHLTLTRTGLYAWVRHPALTGMIILMAGALVMVPTALGVLAAVLAVVAVHIQARAVREPGLRAALGDEYAQYMERTGRYLPRVRTRSR